MEYKHIVPSLEDVVSLRKPLRNPHKEMMKSLSFPERFAVFVHKAVGSVGFFFFLLIWTIVWLGWNIFAPIEARFDPGPAFVIWLFVSNILQLILLPIILVGQNIEGRAAEHRAEKDLQVNLRAEEEIKIIIGHLENQNEMILEVLRKVERN